MRIALRAQAPPDRGAYPCPQGEQVANAIAYPAPLLPEPDADAPPLAEALLGALGQTRLVAPEVKSPVYTLAGRAAIDARLGIWNQPCGHQRPSGNRHL